jgi:GPI-anchor transamidase subunit U
MAQLIPVLLTGFVLRCAAFYAFPLLPAILDGRVECSTPVTSFKRLQEGIFQYQHQRSPYDGGVFHQSPLLLALFSTLPPQYVNVLYSAVDVTIGYLLADIARNLNRRRKDFSMDPAVVATIYLLNPFSLMSLFARSTLLFSNLITTWAIYSAVSKRQVRAVVLLALAVTLSIYPLCLAPAMILLCTEFGGDKGTDGQVRRLSLIFVASVGIFVGLSALPTQSWDFVGSTYGVILLFKELVPNIGLWWYFFTEMFDFFRPFFIGVFQIYVLMFSLPVTIRFRNNPLFALITLMGTTALFKSYPECGDIGYYLSVLFLYRPPLKLLKYGLVAGLAVLYATVLAPTFYHLWIYLGSGNSNFFYAITLVYALSMILIISDSTWAAIRIEYDGGKNPNLNQF